MTAPPRLTIVIVSYNAAAELDACLASLAAAPPQVPAEVIVVDNASTDGSPAVARRAGVRLIETGKNLGFSRANNVGIRSSEGELVLLLNNDTVVPAGAVDALVAELDRRPEVAVVGPRLVDAAGQPEMSSGRMIGPFAELWQKMVGRGDGAGVWPFTAIAARRSGVAGTRDWVSGACLLVRRADAERAGLLDERFFLYTEDVDLCASIRASRRHVWFAANVTVTHLRGRSRASAPARASAWYRRSQLAFYAKHHPGWAPVLRAYLRMKGESPDPD